MQNFRISNITKIYHFSTKEIKAKFGENFCSFPERNLTPEKVHSCPIVGKCCLPKMSKFLLSSKRICTLILHEKKVIES